ncbi:MAG TPA: hypothetical protein V6D04_10175, partial [Candidatus Obscuribacterales bacterium]
MSALVACLNSAIASNSLKATQPLTDSLIETPRPSFVTLDFYSFNKALSKEISLPPAMLKNLLGDPNARKLKKYQPIITEINLLEEEIQGLSDQELRGKTAEFKQRVEKGESLDDLLPEAFAVVREAGKRVLGMRHFDVQLLGGMILHDGQIAEMKTGEGKTLVATLPAYLNALLGNGVHVV